MIVDRILLRIQHPYDSLSPFRAARLSVKDESCLDRMLRFSNVV